MRLNIILAAAPLLAGGRAPPPVTAVIIDPRPVLLYWAVRHAREALDAHIPIVAFTKNATAFAARPDVRRLGNVRVKRCKDDTKKAYNKRLRDAVFWATLQTTHALLFEGDSWFEARPSFPLPYFLSKMDAGGYTMLGAPWDPARPFCQNDAEHCVGNSGASLWHVPRLMDALRDADRLVPSGGERGNVDRFVHRLLRRGNRTVAPAALAARWAEADVASPGVPFARHKPRQMTRGVCFVHLVGDGPFAPPSLTGARTCLVTDAPDAAPAGVDDVVRVGDLRQRFAAVGMPRHALARLVAYEAPPYALTLFPVGAARPSPEWWATLPSNADVLLDGGAVLLRRSAFARVWATALGAYVRANAADPFGAALRDLTRSPGARTGALPALETGIGAKPSGAGSTVRAHVIQMGDARSVAAYATYVAGVRRAADANGFAYGLLPWNATSSTHACPYTAKVAAIAARLRGAPDGAWVVWLDLDVQFALATCGAWWPTLQKIGGDACHLVALRTDRQINTGVLHIKATPAMRELVGAWLAEQLAREVCAGPADQSAFEEVILRKAVPNYGGRCATQGPTMDRGEALADYFRRIARLRRSGAGGLERVGDCFGEEMGMEQRRAPPENVCLVRCRDGLQAHDCGATDGDRRAEAYLFDHAKPPKPGRQKVRAGHPTTDRVWPRCTL